MSIRVNQLLKVYGAQTAVNNISFSLDKGEIVGFLGPNGAGKSTTMKMITGYLKPDGGEIEVGGINAVTHSLEARKKIGYLPEANPLYYDMYIREYLGFIASVHGMRNAKPKIEAAINMVGLMPEAHKKAGQLSKGYKQRVGLAAALIHDPEVLILDEPTSGLDPNQIMEIRSVIRSLAEHRTILFSSHIMQEVESLCKRVIIIHKGNIVADNDLLQLKQQGTADVHQVTIKFSALTDKNWMLQLPGVIKVEERGNETFTLHTTQPDDLRQALLQESVSRGLNILSLVSEQQNLESVFKSLTT